MATVKRNVVPVRYTGNFYDPDGTLGYENPNKWEVEELEGEWWWVREYSEGNVHHPEGVLLAVDVGERGLLEVVLTPEVLDAMLERVKVRSNESDIIRD